MGASPKHADICLARTLVFRGSARSCCTQKVNTVPVTTTHVPHLLTGFSGICVSSTWHLVGVCAQVTFTQRPGGIDRCVMWIFACSHAFSVFFFYLTSVSHSWVWIACGHCTKHSMFFGDAPALTTDSLNWCDRDDHLAASNIFKCGNKN